MVTVEVMQLSWRGKTTFVFVDDGNNICKEGTQFAVLIWLIDTFNFLYLEPCKAY